MRRISQLSASRRGAIERVDDVVHERELRGFSENERDVGKLYEFCAVLHLVKDDAGRGIENAADVQRARAGGRARNVLKPADRGFADSSRADVVRPFAPGCDGVGFDSKGECVLELGEMILTLVKT
jgi:hypothetical protein